MIATWLAVTAGWALSHPVTLIVFGASAVLLTVALALYLRLTSETGEHHTSRTTHPPRWRAGMTRARRCAQAARRLPGAIGWAWRTPVRTTTLGPADSPAPELHHGLDDSDRATLRWAWSLRGLRHPGWNTLTLRRQLTLVRALLASGRVTPGHTAPREHGETGHPAGDAPVREYWSDGPSLVELDAYGDYAPEAAPVPLPHDPALWQPTQLIPACGPLEYEHDTSWWSAEAIFADADARADGA